MLKAYKYRIYPNFTQIKQIEQTFGVCRLVYNMGLIIKIDSWKKLNKRISSFDLMKQLPELKKEFKWISEIDSQALTASLKDMDSAYKNFFKGGGYPKFKSKHDRQSFQAPCNKREIDFEKQLLSIPKLKNIPIVISRKFEGKIKTITISKSPTGKYYASILVDNFVDFPEKSVIDADKTIGIDLGIKDLLITSNGEKIPNPTFFKNGIERLKILQRRASRKKKGSKNRKKANLVLAVFHESIKNKRNDYLHKLTTKLVCESQTTTFCIEDLSASNMMKNHNLAQAISDVSWHEFKRQMEYKCKWYGKNLITIGRFEPSSKICSDCGTKKENLMLSQRTWQCEKCFSTHDRDINAAKNIKFMGLKKSGQDVSVEPLGVVRISENVEGGTMKIYTNKCVN